MIISREDYFILPFYFQGSGLLEFGEFCQLAAKFLVEEDEEALKKELKEAFRIYDKEGEKEEALFTQYTTYNQVHKTSYFLSEPKKKYTTWYALEAQCSWDRGQWRIHKDKLQTYTVLG